MIRSHYAKAFGADLQPAFAIYRGYGSAPAAQHWVIAVPVPGHCFESYLDQPIEDLAPASTGRVPRHHRGNRQFRCGQCTGHDRPVGLCSNDLAADSEVAVATLTLPLRRMFRRIGIPFHVVADAHAGRAPIGASDWGDYYNLEPQVCIGEIALAQQAIEDFMAPRRQAGAA
jgi:hypothetical protein